jgi:hypothetical protein
VHTRPNACRLRACSRPYCAESRALASALTCARQPVNKFAQAAIVESPKRILLPSAICRIEGASEAEGARKVSADCETRLATRPGA